jgi:outer membrane protein assembly factor BamB
MDTDKMFAINPDGTELWRYDTDGAIFGGAAIGQDGTVYFGSDDSYLYAIGTPVPEPGSIGLLSLGAVMVTRVRRRD